MRKQTKNRFGVIAFIALEVACVGLMLVVTSMTVNNMPQDAEIRYIVSQ